MQTRFRLRCW